MVHNIEKLEKARDFRKRGFSYSEIAKVVGVSKSTISNWFGKKSFSKQVRIDNEKRARRDNMKRLTIINKYRKHEREKRYLEAVKSDTVEYKHYKPSPLFVAGLMLYAGKGDKDTSRLIRLTDSNPALHRIFIKFAIEFLGVSQKDIRLWLLLYPKMSINDCIKAWSKVTRIPQTQFYKTQVVDNKSEKRTLHIGVGNTIIGNAYLKRKLTRWIELASSEWSK